MNDKEKLPSAFPDDEPPTRRETPGSRVSGTREKLVEQLDGYGREREVEARVAQEAGTNAMNLARIRMEGNMTGPHLMEYHYCGEVYLYIHEDCTEPSYRIPDEKRRVDIPHPGATVLLKLNKKGQSTEIHRWENPAEQ